MDYIHIAQIYYIIGFRANRILSLAMRMKLK